jgi:hypothetical protein
MSAPYSRLVEGQRQSREVTDIRDGLSWDEFLKFFGVETFL